ncbi:hypothetical protein PtA15_4A79 [Puccinia triticina]|uniref:hAT-like transposase RNase-H fold domain-containing protein n=1 Tax=Puccinia triticina TaxID=208348 RepID=A0ABY7CEK4_9BASI|nr:uncharacterized protein PtA15_4A79 [Puccinia triticina]WAQ83631.1 hypothetical protein PtA15_4A79 [Puccinia triticina]
MEGDRSSACLMLNEYQYIKDFLSEQITVAPKLEFRCMMEKMLEKANTYLTEAIKCDSVLIATVLNPAYQLSIFRILFQDRYKSTKKLFRQVYNQRKSELEDDASPRYTFTTDENPSQSTSRRRVAP